MKSKSRRQILAFLSSNFLTKFTNLSSQKAKFINLAINLKTKKVYFNTKGNLKKMYFGLVKIQAKKAKKAK